MVIKGKYDSSRGAIIVNTSCDGDGCDGAGESSPEEWLQELELSYEHSGGSLFDEIDADALPEKARASYDALLEEYAEEDSTLVAYAWDLHGGDRTLARAHDQPLRRSPATSRSMKRRIAAGARKRPSAIISFTTAVSASMSPPPIAPDSAAALPPA